MRPSALAVTRFWYVLDHLVDTPLE